METLITIMLTILFYAGTIVLSIYIDEECDKLEQNSLYYYNRNVWWLLLPVLNILIFTVCWIIFKANQDDNTPKYT